jgi:hypothetical protein
MKVSQANMPRDKSPNPFEMLIVAVLKPFSRSEQSEANKTEDRIALIFLDLESNLSHGPPSQN